MSLASWRLSSSRTVGRQHHVFEFLCGVGVSSFPCDLLRDGDEAAGGGLNIASWEGVENGPNQIVNSAVSLWGSQSALNWESSSLWILF